MVPRSLLPFVCGHVLHPRSLPLEPGCFLSHILWAQFLPLLCVELGILELFCHWDACLVCPLGVVIQRIAFSLLYLLLSQVLAVSV